MESASPFYSIISTIVSEILHVIPITSKISDLKAGLSENASLINDCDLSCSDLVTRLEKAIACTNLEQGELHVVY